MVIINKVSQKRPIFKRYVISDTGNINRSSQIVIPFLLSIYDTQPSNLTEAVSKTIVLLDDLAQTVDKKLDNPNNYKKNTSIDMFADLEQKVMQCFSPLAETIVVTDLFEETLKAINISFDLNTLKRHQVYNLKDCNSFLGCTMYYTFPLVNFLNEIYLPKGDIRKSYCLLSNLIQAVDDFVDMFEDLSAGIVTPVTLRYSFYQKQNVIDPFVAVQKDVQEFLTSSLAELTIEINKLSTQHGNHYLKELKKFIGDFRKLKLPKNDLVLQKKYLVNTIDITPPILCYTAN